MDKLNPASYTISTFMDTSEKKAGTKWLFRSRHKILSLKIKDRPN